MIIKSLRVQNLRCILDATLQCDQLTAIVGRNGSGKSSFIHALNMFYDSNARYTDEDFYSQDTTKEIIITLTFTELTEDETRLFQRYVENGELTVDKVMKWPVERGSQRYYGTSMQNPEFNNFRYATGQNLRIEYNRLRELDKYSTLPTYTNRDEAEQALTNYEISNQTQCVRLRDTGQFFGFKEVGAAHLERYTRFLFIPAVREASEDAVEGRGSVLTDIMDLVVRSVLAKKEEIRLLQEATQKKYEETFAPSNIPELQGLSSSLSDTLKTFIPSASVELNWIYGENVEIPLPRADVKLVEDEYASSVGRAGHGLQRAFILTMLQHLALAQVSASETLAETDEEVPVFSMPNLILGIEEPELYQHPNRQRHLSKILLKLAEGSIRGVAEKTQIIYSTHSPLFVDAYRFHNIRLLRKIPGEGDNPKHTTVFKTNLDEIAQIIERADKKPTGTYTGETLQPRLLALMTPWMNEGFFTDIAVLVEGEEDRAAIIGTAQMMGLDFESMGITVIPCQGKNNIDRPTAIFTKLGIPTYAIWDSDYGNREANPEDNHRLLRLFGHEEEDWPALITNQFACFKFNMKQAICEEIGADLYDSVLSSCCERLCLGKRKHAVKNPIVIHSILDEAYRQGRACESLNRIVEQIVALKPG